MQAVFLLIVIHLPNPSVLYALAIGRLSVNPTTGDLDPDKHVIIGDNLIIASQKHPSLQPLKKVRNHLKQIMKKGGHKLTPGKRLRLKNEEDGYDVHILGDSITEVSPPVTLIFFVLTIPNFNKYFPIANVLKDYTAATYTEIDAQTLSNTNTQGKAIQSQLNAVFTRVLSQYEKSPLRSVESKVAAVKSIMSSSVARALNSVEQLEDMEEATERLEEHTKQFVKKTNTIKKVSRKNYYVLLGLFLIIVIVVIIFIVVPKGGSSSPSPVVSSTAGGQR